MKKFRVKDHRATGMVEKTIASKKTRVLTYIREEGNQKIKNMILRVLNALRFVPQIKTKLTLFQAHHAREANIVLQNFTKNSHLKI